MRITNHENERTQLLDNSFRPLGINGKRGPEVWQMKLPKRTILPDGTVSQQGGQRVGKTGNNQNSLVALKSQWHRTEFQVH